MSRTCLLINENAGTSEQAALVRQATERHEDIVCRTNESEEEGRALARAAVDDGFERIGAAGGDGTVHAVANAVIEALEERRAAGGGGRPVAFGVVPLGTGNDLARTLALPQDPRDAVAVLVGQAPQPLDLIRITGQIDGEQRTFYGLNAAAGGFSGEVDEEVTTELKKNWGPLAYLVGTARAVPDLQEYETRVAFDDEPPERTTAINVIVANGRTIGGGKRVAPTANPCDGLLDVVVVKWGRMVDFAGVGARLMAGTWLESPHILHRRARKVRVESEPGLWFNVDGELKTKEPLTFEVLPGALPVVVGPEFEAEVSGA